ncbi:HWE histidine kinase domain-containing protein [Roseobacter sp.]|uniref:HWE histidine kinase domain-containing protein n=1 Tax=Roseobacter sp. TaxID=1907202 RepID=UPI00260123A3|nr:HWE histidine kinase domain-containing protein [Roseobacter sp.]
MTDTPSEDAGLREEISRLQAALDLHTSERNADKAISRQSATRMRLLEAMMETVPVGVVLADADGKILHGNSNVEEMLRHPVLYSGDTESYGEWISFHEDGTRVESHEYPLARIISDGETRSEIDVEYQRGDGTRFWLRIIGEPVLDAEGKRIGATVALIDIDEERQLKKAQEILIAELNHRVKNAFSVVKSIVSQSLRKLSVQDGLRQTIDSRLDAYAGAHAKLVGTTWDEAPVGDVARDILDPIGGGRIEIKGPVVTIPSRQALAFSMAFYELATNAVKYGALSVPDGRVTLTWNLTRTDARSVIEMRWKERGGPVPDQPTETGFGSFITGRALQMETGGRVTTTFPEEGYEWHLEMPAEEKEEKFT